MFEKLRKLWNDLKTNRRGWIVVWILYPLGQILLIVLSSASRTNWAGWIVEATIGSPWYPFG